MNFENAGNIFLRKRIREIFRNLHIQKHLHGLYSSTLATLRGTLRGWSALYEVSLRLVGITAFTFEEQSTVLTQV